MNIYFSDKLKIISVICMIMVVFTHSYNINLNFTSGNISFNNVFNVFIQTFISDGITRISVPQFFIFSGYLFFLNLNGSFDEYFIKYKKRIKSVLIPYLLWSLWGLVFYFVLQSIPFSKIFFTKDLVTNYSLIEILYKILIDPIPYQLWFLRDLIGVITFAPLIYIIIKRFKFYPLLILFMHWLMVSEYYFIFFSNKTLLFFSLGAYFAIHRNKFLEKKLDNQYYWLVTIIWLVTTYIITSLKIDLNAPDTFYLSVVRRINMCIGVISFWSLYDLFMKNKSKANPILLKISGFSFFIYVFHEPILSIIKKGIFYLTGSSELFSLINFFLVPTITISLAILVAKFLKIYYPSFYHLITGGR